MSRVSVNTTRENRWVLKRNADEEAINNLVSAIGISQTLAKILGQRDITDFEMARQFFRPDLKMLHNPFLMKDMDVAVSRIKNAIAKGEKILIYGDYDVDGTTSVSLVYSFLKPLVTPNTIDYYIPDRYSEGYGISFKGIDFAAENNFSLVIALDCGIKANDKIDYANNKGIDFIICDHHRPGDVLPSAVAILNPKRTDCIYPYEELSGCGIGFKLIQAFAQKEKIDEEQVYNLLDLAAISIACDIVPVTGENRILTYYGLERLKKSPRPGIQSLIELSKKGNELTVSDLVFVIGPRINAAGRIDHAKKAVELLISEHAEVAQIAGKAIEAYNAERREIDMEITTHALELIAEDDFVLSAKSTVLFHEKWHKGVIGIVASRLMDNYYRPTVLLTSSNGMATGSARSVKDFDIYEAIEACSHLLEQFGGHKYAAGLTLKQENIEAFRKKFEEVVSAKITDEQLIPSIEIDAEIGFAEITDKFFRILQQFAPFGPGNMKPVFVSHKVTDSGGSRIIGTDGKHLLLKLKQENYNSYPLTAMAFNMACHFDKIKSGQPFSMVYTIDENIWNGQRTIRLTVKDIRFEN
jgi:single-stranded-DNA-specific exonuclease